MNEFEKNHVVSDTSDTLGVVGWGIIGCGDVVETKNGPGTYLAEGSELVGIWNRTKSKAEEWTRRHGHGSVFDSVEELLADPSVDILYVATTPNCHKEYALAVAEAGKHCYLEKPIALSWDEAQEIKAAFEKSGTRCFVAHYRRGMPRYKTLKQILDGGNYRENSRCAGYSNAAANCRRNAS